MKKLILILTVVAMLICALAISVSAAEPDTTKESVTLSDGTVCPIWDTDGDALIWYISGTKDDGTNAYSYVKATSSEVDYNSGWSGTSYGVPVIQVSSVTIKVDGVSYDKSKFVVLNLKDDIKVTSNQNIGQPINCLSKTFTSATNLEYVYLPLNFAAFNSEVFKSCSKLKYINLPELTELSGMSSQEFNGCNVLFEGMALDLSGTKLSTIGSGAFSGCKATSIKFPVTLSSLGKYSLRNCSEATVIEFTGNITSINSSELFSGCKKLVEIKGFASAIENKALKSIGDYMFNECNALENIDGLMKDGILIIPETITSIGSPCAFTKCHKIEYVEFPSTITYVGQAAFSYCTNLKLVSFDKVDAKIREAVANGEDYTKVTFNNCGTFKGCTNLAAMCVPYGTTDIINRFVAENCTSLTAFYMPDTVTFMGTNGGSYGPFCNATNMYFVSEPFTVGQCLVDGKVDLSKLELPEKPSVYFMPSALTTFGGHVESNQYAKSGTFFQNCTSLNDVIVFGENFVNFNANNAFDRIGTESSPKTIVFLGDIQSYVTNQNAKYISFVFANKNDKTPSDLGITHVYKNNNNNNSYMYFCATNSKYDYHTSSSEITDATAVSEYVNALVMISEACHVTDPNKESDYVDADCVNNSGVVEYCFCGAVSEKIDEENTALGHEFNVENGAKILSIVYANYFNYGDKTTKCARCDVNEETKASPIIIDFKGFSTKEDGDGITFGYYIDEEALVLFENVNEIKLEFGFVVAVKNFVVGDSLLNADGTVAETTCGSVVKAVASSKAGYYTGYDFKLTGAWNKMVDLDSDNVAETDIKDVQFYMAGYVFDGAVSYIQSETETSSTVSAFTYNDIK